MAGGFMLFCSQTYLVTFQVYYYCEKVYDMRELVPFDVFVCVCVCVCVYIWQTQIIWIKSYVCFLPSYIKT